MLSGSTKGTRRSCSGQNKSIIRQLLLDAGVETLATDDALYQALGFAPSAIDTNEALNNLLNAGYRQTLGTWQNLAATTANTVTGEFERALDRAWLQVSSGAFDYKTAIKRAVDSLAAHMAGVTYPSGHKDTLEVAARRAVLTGVNQTAAKLQLARAEEIGCEFVEVSAHAGARPEHAVWQGKVYHVGGAAELDGVLYEDFETTTGYGTGPGLCGWNCRHNFYPFFPGVSKRTPSNPRSWMTWPSSRTALPAVRRAAPRRPRTTSSPSAPAQTHRQNWPRSWARWPVRKTRPPARNSAWESWWTSSTRNTPTSA